MIFKVGYDATHGKRLKVLTPKKVLQRLQIALAQINAGNTSENVLKRNLTNHLFFVSSKNITKKVYNYVLNSV